MKAPKHNGAFMNKTATQPPPSKPETLLRLPDVEKLTALRKSSIYAGMKAGTFPYCVRLSTRAVAWKESEIQTWIGNRIAADGRHD
jgi:prophage regulatory protein